jgi:ABC-type sugar transport system ATPase subunit
VTLGIRPEHLGPAIDGYAIEAAVEWVEALGADTVAHTRLPNGAALGVRLDGATIVREGDRLRLTVAPDSLHLFDPEGGWRI